MLLANKLDQAPAATTILSKYSSLLLYFKKIDLENDEINFDTTIYGNDSRLDSLGLINLIVAVEQNVEDKFDITITLADERAMSQEISPFRTVGSLADYIEMILEENKND